MTTSIVKAIELKPEMVVMVYDSKNVIDHIITFKDILEVCFESGETVSLGHNDDVEVLSESR